MPRSKSLPVKSLVEFRLTGEEGKDLAAGSELKVDLFQVGQIVDVTGTTIGKGFAGTIKRHNFGGLAGNARRVRIASLAGFYRSASDAGSRVQGKRMSGHMGVERRTIENLQVVRVDAERNLLLIRGAVPGAPGGQVIVRPSIKAAGQAARKRKAAAAKAAAGKAAAPGKK